MDKSFILTEIRRTAEENGGPALGIGQLEKATGIRRSDWHGKIWARWADAVAEAGLIPNKLVQRYDDDVILLPIVLMTRELARLPTNAEMRLRRQTDRSIPAHNTIGRLGSKRELAAKVAAYCTAHPEYADVEALCGPVERKTEVPPLRLPRREQEPIHGDVYLIKSGSYYKIGRSNAAGRREREIALQLPEKVSTVHIIRTDDPMGIEAYWHKRFSAKRLNGEWFDLDAEDVRTFKRRKFM